jgi:hypothetical protein
MDGRERRQNMAEQVEVKTGTEGAVATPPPPASTALAGHRSGWEVLDAFQSEMEDLWGRFWPSASRSRTAISS